jgi:hypothetical protein
MVIPNGRCRVCSPHNYQVIPGCEEEEMYDVH